MKKKYVSLYLMFIGIVLYLIHYCFRCYSFDYQAIHFRNYFADFLALIVCVPLFVNIQIFFKVRNSEKIKFSEIAFFFCVFSVLYEVICPYLLNKMTADIVNVLYYALGGIVLYLSQKITTLYEPKSAKKKWEL